MIFSTKLNKKQYEQTGNTFHGQWADLKLEDLCRKAKDFGYDGLELACWGDHFEVDKADQAYCNARKPCSPKYGLKLFAISNHLVGQAVCDRIDQRHKDILPAYVWGDVILKR